MIRRIPLLYGASSGAEIINTRFTKHMNPVINTSFDPDTLDNSQCFLNTAFETTTQYRALYTGANTEDYVYPPDGLTYNNVDQVFMAIKTKSNDVTSGWNKLLDVNSEPKPVFQPTFIAGRFDEAQVWMRAVIKEGSTLYGWYSGDDGTPTFVYKIGLATSSDDGETWTRHATTPIYEDALTSSRGIPVFKVVWNGTKYLAFYNAIDPNVTGFQIAESTDKIAWTKIHSNLMSNQNLGFIGNVTYVNSTYYIWTQKNFQTGSNFGPAREVHVYSSTNLTTWTPLGAQLHINGSNEFGVGSDCAVLQKPNGQYFMLHSAAKNRTQALASSTKEASSFIKVAESTAIIQNSAPVYAYPDYVLFHAPLGSETGIVDVINNVGGTITGVPAWAEYQLVRLNGSQVITIANPGINGANFGVKLRVQVLTTGTHELFRIGNDVLITLESGKLRCRLSSNGAGYEKDYITSVNISKPVGIDYIDDHIYVAIHWNGTVLRMFNDFVEFTAGEITETVDNALTTINNSLSNVLIGQNATLELGWVSIVDSTVTELTELDI